MEMLETLKQQGYSLFAAELKGDTEPAALTQPEKLVLALGNEAAGLSSEVLKLADSRVRIPIAVEKAESLNVAVSGGILMYLSSGK